MLSQEQLDLLMEKYLKCRSCHSTPDKHIVKDNKFICSICGSFVRELREEQK